MAGPIAGIMSRKTTVWTASVLCIVSNVIMMATTNIEGLYAGRLLLGLANGLFMTFSQLYIQVGFPRPVPTSATEQSLTFTRNVPPLATAVS
jgi:predicted MFS family arabinose efflux permease